ncbi:MAG: addiction module antidote protein [Pseudomonadota bacterium]
MKNIDLNNLPKGYTVFDAADYIKNEDEISGFLKAALEEGEDDPAYIAEILGAVARARGMTKVAKKAGLSRSALYNALSKNGNPEFATILKVISALGLKLKVV